MTNEVERLIIMVDIRDLKHIHNPMNRKLYLAAIKDCICKLLENSTTGNGTVWAFKLLDSSMWPYRSRSYIEQTVGKWAGHVHFEPTTQTDAFFSALKSLATANFGALCCPDFVHGGRLHFISRSMLELVNDYIWDPQICMDMDTKKYYHPIPCSTNLVVLFSPFPWTRNGFRDFLMEDKVRAVLSASSFEEDLWELFCMKLRSVKEEFKSRDIHCCWIDIPPIYPAQEVIECEINPEQVIEAFKTIQWSFQTMDTLLVASISVPFQLIWPTIVYSSSMLPPIRFRTCGEVFVEVKGIDRKPVRGRVCKVQCIDLEKNNLDFVEGSKACMDHLGGLDFSTIILKGKDDRRRILNSSNFKIRVDEIFWKDKCPDLSSVISECVMVQNVIPNAIHFQEVGEDFEGIGDEMLERLQQKHGEFVRGKPSWQLLLAYLSCQKCMALVTVSDNGFPSSAILDPFTVHCAFLYVLNSNAQLTITCISSTNNNVEVHCDVKENVDNCLQVCKENHEPISKEKVKGGQHKRKRARTTYKLDCISNSKILKASDLNIYKCNTWDSLYSAIVWGLCKEDQRNVDHSPTIKLESRYIERGQNSKILRLLNCWFNQKSKKLDVDHYVQLKHHQEEELIKPTSIDSEPMWDEGEGESYIPTEFEHVNLILSSEDAEKFIGSLDEKIQHGISNMEVDLGALAKRFVEILVQILEAQCLEIEKSDDVEKPSIFEQLKKLLLKNPKELVSKYKGCLLPLSTLQPGHSDLVPATYTSEDKVREHELQILFRMEILATTRSGMESDGKEIQLTEDICKLLENIQFNLPGGIMEGQSLIEFCDRVIKIRYVNILSDIVENVYQKMDFEAPDIGSTTSSPNNFMASDEVITQELISKKKKKKPPKIGDDYETKLKKAQLKRERARRFSHFSSRAPNLERVWTPKAPSQPPKRQSKKCHVAIDMSLKDDADSKSAIRTKTKNLVRDEAVSICETPKKTIEEVDYQFKFFVGEYDSNDDNNDNDDDIDCVPESPK